MTRNDYIEGQPFPASKWNVLANLSRKSYELLNEMGDETGVTKPSASLTGVDVLGQNVEYMTQTHSASMSLISDQYTSFVNPDDVSPEQLNFTSSILNAENITELETLNWFDETNRVAKASIFIDEQKRIFDPNYTSYNLTESTQTFTKESGFEDLGDVWKNDLTKAHKYENGVYTRYNMPDGTIDVQIQHPTLSTLDISGFPDVQWERRFSYLDATYLNYDETFLYVYNVYRVHIENEFSNDEDARVYVAYVVSKIDNTGQIIEENQYYHQVAFLSINDGSVSSATRNKIGIQQAGDSIFFGVQYYGNEGGKDVQEYFTYGLMTPTGFNSIGTQTYSFSDDGNTDDNYSYGGSRLHAVGDGTNQVIAWLFTAAEYFSDTPRSAEAHWVGVKCLNGTVSVSVGDDYISDNDSNRRLNYYIGESNATNEIYLAYSLDVDDDRSGPDRHDGRASVLKYDTTGVSKYQTYDISNLYDAYTRFIGKLAINYKTNTVDILTRHDFNDDSLNAYVYTYYKNGVEITEDEYNSVPINDKIYSLNGNLSEGFNIHGRTYSFTGPEFGSNVVFDYPSNYYKIVSHPYLNQFTSYVPMRATKIRTVN